ncbi:MAG: glycine betaine ABC transporter substrate-binding protein [Candidatus Acidiferrales bacterium]
MKFPRLRGLAAARAPLPLAVIAMWLLASCGVNRRTTIVVGSKNFTEQAILGEILAQQIETHTHLQVMRRFYLTGSYICQQAILAGRIDVYVEYTGTALTAILKDPLERDPRAVFAKVRDQYAGRFGLTVLPSLGFDNTFAIVVRGEDARALHLTTISDLSRIAPRWRAGFGYEFKERPDGYEGLARAYGLQFAAPPRIMDLGLLYRALLDKQVDVVAGNATDGLLEARDLAVLADDKHYFPPYEAVPVLGRAVMQQHPEVAAAIAQLEGKISDDDMRKMNYAVDGRHEDPSVVVKQFLTARGLE